MIKYVNSRLMIILFHLKLNEFYRIAVMDSLKVICYDLFFCSYKSELLLA